MPEPSYELMRAQMLDLSPLRPWETAQVSAKEWFAAIQLRNAFQDGVDDANEEAEARAAIAATRP